MEADVDDPLRLDLTKLKESADHLLAQIDAMAALARHERDEGNRDGDLAIGIELVADLLRTMKPLPADGARQKLVQALKRGEKASADRVVETLYQLAIGWKGGKPDLGAICFYLKNKRPSEWRDVQNITADVGHYIISDRPMSEDEWIAARTKTIEAKPTDS